MVETLKSYFLFSIFNENLPSRGKRTCVISKFELSFIKEEINLKNSLLNAKNVFNLPSILNLNKIKSLNCSI